MATTVTIPRDAHQGMSDDEFLAFLKKRPHEERWQLIDGEAIMMNPPKLRHQEIGSNLAWELNLQFRRSRPELKAIQEIGVLVPGVPRFRSRADVAVIDNQVDRDTSWADRSLLVAEVLSDSNTAGRIERKRLRYIEHPLNLYVLVIAQREIEVHVWSRSSDWERQVLRHADDELELPELAFSLAMRALYFGTGVV